MAILAAIFFVAACGDGAGEGGEAAGLVQELRSVHPAVAELLADARKSPVQEIGAGSGRGGTLRVVSAVRQLGLDPVTGTPNGRGVVADLGRRPTDVTVLRRMGSAKEIAVRRPLAGAAAAEIVDGAVVYRGVAPGADAVVLAAGDGIEELLVFRNARADVPYLLELPPEDTIHRVSRGLVELRDVHGVAWLRLRVDRAWDGKGRSVTPNLEIEGGAIHVSLKGADTMPVVVDPEWESTGSMSIVREHASAALLPSGKVLIVGGFAPNVGYLSSAETYDPATESFTVVGPCEDAQLQPTNACMKKSRSYHTATLLRTGEVLITGGLSTAGGIHSAAEIFDETKGAFSSVEDMAVERAHHTATLLPSGGVLVAGGDANSGPLDRAEIFDPSTRQFQDVGECCDADRSACAPGCSPCDAPKRCFGLREARYGHTATPLRSGKVLFAGGITLVSIGDGGSVELTTSSAEVFDPPTGTFVAAGPMTVPRARQTATLVPSGDVLVAGGSNDGGQLSTAEVFDASAGTFTATGSLAGPRSWHTATLLPSGSVVLGGGNSGGGGLSTAERYDPLAGTFSPLPSMVVERRHHVAVLLPTGKVLFAGGPFNAAVDLYDSTGGSNLGSFLSTGDLGAARQWATATLLASGRVLIVGGVNQSGFGLSSAEIFDPSTGLATPTGSMSQPRSRHTATLLRSGKVLVAGGLGVGVVTTAEVYDPDAGGGAGAFEPPLAMVDGRMAHTATLLSSGEVLLAGGFGSAFSDLTTAELFDPSSGQFEKTADLHVGRAGHSATRLRSGKVLIASGGVANLSAEIYDRSANGGAGDFQPTGNLAQARFGHVGVLLPSGRVLVAGGEDGPVVLSSAELFDPEAGGGVGGFTPTGHLVTKRSGFTATALPSGRVLVVGGKAGDRSASTAELYDPNNGSNGAFVQVATMATSRLDHVAALLPDGRVLVAAGAEKPPAVQVPTPIRSVEIWESGRVGNPAWRPTVTAAPSSVVGSRVYSGASGVFGAGFTGVSDASYGATHSSGTAYPIGVWLPAGGGWGEVGRLAPWSDASADWLVPATGLAGPGWLFVVANAIPSTAVPVTVAPAPDASACTVGGACASGYCVDGVCCDGPCDEPCEACTNQLKGSGADGACGPVVAGSDPKDACDAQLPQTCGATGACDGTGQCALYAAGSECLPPLCSGAVLSPGGECDGAGSCVTQPPVDCSPGRCAAQGGKAACTTDCLLDEDCGGGVFGWCRCPDGGAPPCLETGSCQSPGQRGASCSRDRECLTQQCADGVCCDSACAGSCEACVGDETGGVDGVCAAIAPGKVMAGMCDPRGVPCSANEACQSGFCVDGVCCTSRCDGRCEACDEPGRVGECVAVEGPPRGARQPCGGDSPECAGTCNGEVRAACSYPAEGVPCGAGSCTDRTTLSASFCDGNGRCVGPSDVDCGAYACDEVTASCNTSCTDKSDCNQLFRCDQGACVPSGASICDVDEGGMVAVSIAPNGDRQPCTPYACDEATGLCESSCSSRTDCQRSYDCSADGECIEPFPSPDGPAGCVCSVPGRRPLGVPVPPGGLLVGLLVLRLGRRGAQKG